MALAEVPDYVRARLCTVTEVEAATAVLSLRRWRQAADRPAALAEVDAAWRVRTPSRAVREASDLLGRSYLRTARAVWDLAGLDPRGPWCRAVVLGATASAAGLGPAEVARLVGYEDVQTVIAAALKLEPFDPALGVRWAAGAATEVEAMVGRVAEVTAPEDVPAWSAPQIEEWAERHAVAERRLFRA
jgi:urease accessory protein